MMKTTYYNFAMHSFDSKAIERVARKLYGDDIKVFIEGNQITFDELYKTELAGKKIKIENCDKSAVTKPAYVSFLRNEQNPESFTKLPDLVLEIAADNGIAEKARKTIERILNYR